ncbi:MAG: hypothetical protein EOO68_08865 [Moraxellaceae bacterium]|nr:MAG: hypothetical protein EOO68_08865 [Moraxellaceae bacterium]
MSTEIPLKLVLQHRATISAMLVGLVRSSLPFTPKHQQNYKISQHGHTPDELLNHTFQQWAGMQHTKTTLSPPLLVSQTLLSAVATLTSHCPYPLLNVLNQGLKLTIFDSMQPNQPCSIQGELMEASDDGYRAKIHSHVVLSNDHGKKIMSLDAYAAVMLKSRPQNTLKKPAQAIDWQTIDLWQMPENAGMEFFLLTGDFNPIHTVPWLARRTRFAGCIMHGYGAFSKIYAAIENQGVLISEIETRFIKPVPLPTPLLHVQTATDPLGQLFRLVDDQGQAYQSGRYQLQAQTS